MPLFKKSATFEQPKKSRHVGQDSHGKYERTHESTESLPARLPEKQARETASTDEQPKFVFYVQLAHGSSTQKIYGFSNVKELYERIGQAFGISSSEILFCTLNTFSVDMERLLGGQIGLDDFIFAHVKGQTKNVEIVKTEPAIGLTITDNGAGNAFIKRVKEGSIAEKCEKINVGDHIVAVNGLNVIGSRHYDVAKMLKEFPLNESLTFTFVEPKLGFEGIAPRSSSNSGGGGLKENGKISEAVGSGKATLRLRSTGPAVFETQEAPAWEIKAAKKVDDLLESFLGIRDVELAESLVDLGKDKRNPSDYAVAVEESFGDFEFPMDFIFDIWGCINDAQQGRI